MPAVILVLHHLHASRGVARGDAVIDQRLAVPLRVPLIHVHRAVLGVQHGRDPVQRAKAVVQVVHAVAVDIDQARRDDQAGGVDGRRPLQRPVADGRNSTAGNAHMGDPIETGLGIHDVAVGDHEIVARAGAGQSGQERQAADDVHPSDEAASDAARPNVRRVLTPHGLILRRGDERGFATSPDVTP
jgi:hypothetical protein